MPRAILLFLLTVTAYAEVISGGKIFPGGAPATNGVVYLDSTQHFGLDAYTYQVNVFPGIHTLVSNVPFGYVVSYSLCVNCTNHPPSSYQPGNTATVVVPINASVDVYWMYSPNPGQLTGTSALPDGSPFTSSTLLLDSTQAVATPAAFSIALPAGTHTLFSGSPTGFNTTYSVCVNCTQHPPASYQNGALATFTVPPAGYVDARFQYTALDAATITVTSPTPSQTVTGTLALSVTGGDLAKAASVEYTIGSNRIARVPAQTSNPSFSTTWNSALASDGNSQLEVTARDYLDNIIYQDFRSIVLHNFGNAASAPLPSVLTGAVPVTLTAYDQTHFPAYWQVFIDGELGPSPYGLLFSDQDAAHQNARSTIVDSTAYPNGKHEVHFAFHSNDYPVTNTSAPGLDFRGMVTQNVTITNARALAEILPNYLFIYTPVSTGVQLTCSRVFTNQDRDPCAAPTYNVDPLTSSPAIQVSASGLITAQQEGYGDIIVSEGGKTAVAHVWVRNTPGLPHFQDAGNYGAAYIAGKSIFATAAFQLTPDLVQADATLLAEVRRAGVNTLNKGIFLPNSNIGLSFAAWKTSYDNSSYVSNWNWARANGFRVLGSGDDIVRRPGWEGSWIANWPAASQAVQYAMQKFTQSGAGLALDVVDEASALWGTNPAPVGLIGMQHSFQSAACTRAQCSFSWLSDPTDYTFHDPILPGGSFLLGGTSALATPAGSASTITSTTATQVNFTISNGVAGTRVFDTSNSPNLEYLWFSGRVSCQGNVMCNPALPNTLLSNVSGWLRGAAATVPISWPPAGAAPVYGQRNWLKPGGVSDYASHYWDSNQQRRTYSFGMGVRENQNSMLTAFLGRQSSVNINRPQLLEQTMAGIDYLKFSAAGNAVYTPPTDRLLHVGAVPRAVVSGIMSAAAVGSAGVKLYKFDTAFTDRRDSLGNGAEFESDGGPNTGEVLNWQAMGYASATLTKALQEYVLGTPVNSPYLGRNIITGARTSTNGNLLIVVNGWDAPRTVLVDLSAYTTGRAVLRYNVFDTGIKVQSLGNIVGDTVTLRAGETAAYLLPKVATVPGIETIIFQPDQAGNRTMLRTNYLYSQNTPLYGDAVDCTAGCSAIIDRKLGEAFYSYAVLNSSDAVQCRSTPALLPAGSSVSLAVNPATRGPFCQ